MLLVLVLSSVAGLCTTATSDKVVVAGKRRDLPVVSSPATYKLVFYTGQDVWAGTDASIYVELNGDLGNSPIVRLVPKRQQLEAGGVDAFHVDLGAEYAIGALKSIVVGKQHTYALFNDWQIDKVEVYDALAGVRYTFRCDCWLTRTAYKRMMFVSGVESVGVQGGTTKAAMFGGVKHSRVFPLTVFLLFVLFVLVVFTYFGSSVCRKWKDRLLNRATSDASAENRHNIYPNRDTTIPLNTALVSNIHSANATIEDKPPDYKVLFPNESDQTVLRACPVINTSNGISEVLIPYSETTNSAKFLGQTSV